MDPAVDSPDVFASVYYFVVLHKFLIYCILKEIVTIQNIDFNSIADIFSIRC